MIEDIPLRRGRDCPHHRMCVKLGSGTPQPSSDVSERRHTSVGVWRLLIQKLVSYAKLQISGRDSAWGRCGGK